MKIYKWMDLNLNDKEHIVIDFFFHNDILGKKYNIVAGYFYINSYGIIKWNQHIAYGDAKFL